MVSLEARRDAGTRRCNLRLCLLHYEVTVAQRCTGALPSSRRIEWWDHRGSVGCGGGAAAYTGMLQFWRVIQQWCEAAFDLQPQWLGCRRGVDDNAPGPGTHQGNGLVVAVFCLAQRRMDVVDRLPVAPRG